MKVLLVSGKRDAASSWAANGGGRLELSYARTLAAAADRLGSETVDAIVIGGDIAAEADGQAVQALTYLRDCAHGAPLLLL